MVSGDLVFLGGSTGSTMPWIGSPEKRCGKKILRFEVDAPALIQEDRVYLGTKDGFVVCLNAQTGEKKWSYETMGEIVGAPSILAHQDGRPLLLVGSYDNFIHCLEAKDGKLLWKFETMNYINGTPAVWGKEAVVFGGCDAQLYVISTLDGHLIRRARFGCTDCIFCGFAGSIWLCRKYGQVGAGHRSYHE